MDKRVAKVEINWVTYYPEDKLNLAPVHIPYSYKCGNCGCGLERTYNNKNINYCPLCGVKLEWM